MSRQNQSRLPFKVRNYQCISELGQGRNGSVFIALSGGQSYALKELRPLINETIAEKLLKQIYATSVLRDSNISVIEEIFEHENRTYVASEFIDGIDLNALLSHIRYYGLISADIAFYIFASIAKALSIAHSISRDGERKMVHGALWPSNILMSENGRIKVRDFGLWQPHSVDWAVQGAIEVSPEHVQGAELIPQSDIFALGAIFYHLVTGHGIYEGKKPFEVIQATNQKTSSASEPLTVGSIEHVPVALRTIIRRCLAFDPRQRYQNAQQLVQEIQKQRPTALSNRIGHQLGELIAQIRNSQSVTPSKSTSERSSDANASAKSAVLAAQLSQSPLAEHEIEPPAAGLDWGGSDSWDDQTREDSSLPWMNQQSDHSAENIEMSFELQDDPATAVAKPNARTPRGTPILSALSGPSPISQNAMKPEAALGDDISPGKESETVRVGLKAKKKDISKASIPQEESTKRFPLSKKGIEENLVVEPILSQKRDETLPLHAKAQMSGSMVEHSLLASDTDAPSDTDIDRPKVSRPIPNRPIFPRPHKRTPLGIPTPDDLAEEYAKRDPKRALRKKEVEKPNSAEHAFDSNFDEDMPTNAESDPRRLPPPPDGALLANHRIEDLASDDAFLPDPSLMDAVEIQRSHRRSFWAYVMLLVAIAFFITAVGILVVKLVKRKRRLREEQHKITIVDKTKGYKKTKIKGENFRKSKKRAIYRREKRTKTKKLSRLAITAPKNKRHAADAVFLESIPAASIYLNGKYKGKTPKKIKFEKDRTFVVVKKKGYALFSKVLERGAKGHIKIELEEADYPFSNNKKTRAILSVSCKRSDTRRIFINDKDSGYSCPKAVFYIRPGKYHLDFMNISTGKLQRRWVKMKRGKHGLLKL